MKMTHSEAGKIGAANSAKVAKLAQQNRINEYNKNPKLCKGCQSPIDCHSKRNSFCGQSCSATFYNLLKGKKDKTPSVKQYRELQLNKTYKCLNCDIENKTQKGGVDKYCSNKCQLDFQYKIFIDNWLSGNNTQTTGLSKYIRRYLMDKHNLTCTNCNLSEWLGKPITLEVEHIDGNSENNKQENLSLLCPNCHSQTDTYKAKNKGNGRHSRMKRYREGKSF